MICKHCQDPTRTVNRPRGLCWNCYYRPGVRDQYQPKTNHGKRFDETKKQAGPPDSPTDATPGSEAKILVLIDRVALRQDLHHPKDARKGT